MTTAASPDWIAPWDLDERIVTAQRVAMSLIDAGNWIWAHKALGRVDRLFSRKSLTENPFVRTGREVFTGITAPLKRPPPPPPTAARPDPAEVHARLVAQMERLNAVRRERGEKLATLRSVLALLEDEFGPDFVAEILAVEERLDPNPTG